MATIPVYNPVMPFTGLIPGSARPGQILKINGRMNGTGEYGVINLQKDPSPYSHGDHILHLSIRPQQRVIVRNHFQYQNWGSEERYGGCPIRVNQQFEIIITIEENQFKIDVNGSHFCYFKYRLPLHEGKYICVKDGCTIQSITLDHNSYYFPQVPNSTTHHHHHHHFHHSHMSSAPPSYSASMTGAQHIGFRTYHPGKH